MIVALLTNEQANNFMNLEFANDCRCYPVQDGLGRWVIGIDEMNGIGLDCELVEWIPVEKIPLSDEIQ
jgi:hypothetical protein